MKLVLKNFRCYDDAEFDLGDAGVTLISGSSGKGKTTLMMAIEFALFGTGVKLQTYGKKFCSVTFTTDEFKIYRQKGPNRLIVNDKYEDGAGEAIIKNHFGSNLLSYYIPQNMRKSFVLMTPIERLEFIESFAFSSVNISELKANAKLASSNFETEHVTTLGELKSAKMSLDLLPKPEKVAFPIKCAKENRQKIIDNMHVKYKNCKIILNRIAKKSESLKAELADLSRTEHLNHEYKQQLQSLTSRIKDVPQRTDFDKLKEYQALLDNIIAHKKFIQTRLDYQNSVKQLETLKKDEIAKLRAGYSELKSQVWTGGPSRTETKSKITSFNKMIPVLNQKTMLEKTKAKIIVQPEGEEWISRYDGILERISNRTTELNDLKRKLKLQSKTMTCPHCMLKVYLKEDELVVAETIGADLNTTIDGISRELGELNKSKNGLKSMIDSYKDNVQKLSSINSQLDNLSKTVIEDNVEVKLKELVEYDLKNTNIETQISEFENKIQNNIFSQTIMSLEKATSLLKKQVDGFNSDITPNEDEESVRHKLDLIKEQILIVSEIERSNAEKMHEIDMINRKMKSMVDIHCNTWGSMRQKNDVESDISALMLEKADTEKTQTDISDLISKVEKYKQYEENTRIYNMFHDRCVSLTAKELETRLQYQEACLFRQKIVEAESIAIQSLVETINTHTQLYLDKFFPDDPINIRLCAFKETKDATKPQINLEIDYKGIEHDIGMLSGGEMSRVILAFTLALSEIHSTKFVMLDESTASLDQDLTEAVIDGMKENLGGKMVILIAHQVIQGAFDKVVKL